MMTNIPPEIRLILAKNLKEQRKKLGLSQEKFAEISGLSIQTVNDIESCRKWICDKTMTKLSQFSLHTTVRLCRQDCTTCGNKTNSFNKIDLIYKNQ
jgi:transcriptional regulator with XRE-family HTH domain